MEDVLRQYPIEGLSTAAAGRMPPPSLHPDCPLLTVSARCAAASRKTPRVEPDSKLITNAK